MNCPRCSGENITNNICNDCHTDIILFEKIIYHSDKFYNKALVLANSNDLSGAVDCLKKSLKFNKRNINSRNLLGLIYFEIGRLGEGYNQFLLSSKIDDSTDNKAKTYIDMINKDEKNLEQLKESVRMYNQSLTYFSQKSDDMAIIQLKKAVDINPVFIDALNLLSLCYIYQKDSAKAAATIEKVLAIDIKNEKALDYRSQILTPPITKLLETSKTKKESKKRFSMNYLETERKGLLDGFGVRSFIYILIGFVLSFLIFYILIIPGITTSNKELIKERDEKINTLQTKQTQLEEEHSKTVEEFDKTRTELEEKNRILQEEVSLTTKQNTLTSAAELISQGEYEEAASLLISIDTTGLSQELLDKQEQLKTRSFQRAANSIYNRAVSKYRSKVYDEAEVLFYECLKYADTTSSQAGDSIFYLGEIAASRDNIEKAKELYEKVVNEHRNSNNYWTARNRLNQY